MVLVPLCDNIPKIINLVHAYHQHETPSFLWDTIPLSLFVV